MSFVDCHKYRDLYSTCAKNQLTAEEFNDCAEYLECLCQNDEADDGFPFGPYCNARSYKFFESEVLSAYNKVVDRWINQPMRPASFAKRGWNPNPSNHDSQHNIVSFCNDRVNTDSRDSRLNHCDTWFTDICQSHPEVDVDSYPWCACMRHEGYDMEYYDPDSYVFNNPSVTAGDGSGVQLSALPNNPYCFMDQCRNNPAAYKWGENIRGQDGCPICINVFNPENVNFINSMVVQVCDGDGFVEEPLVPPTSPGRDRSPLHDESSAGDYMWFAITGFGVFAFVMVLLVVIRKRTARAEKQAQQEVFKMASLVSSTNNGP